MRKRDVLPPQPLWHWRILLLQQLHHRLRFGGHAWEEQTEKKAVIVPTSFGEVLREEGSKELRLLTTEFQLNSVYLRLDDLNR